MKDDNVTTSTPPPKRRHRQPTLLEEVLSADPLQAGCLAVLLVAFGIYEPVKALSTFSGVAVLALVYFLRQRFSGKKSTTEESDDDEDDSFRWAEKGADKKDNPPSLGTKLKNVWDVSRNSAASASSTTKQAASKEKPFGSSYYYAHNDPNRTGGYKDGLRMEDYRMNGPRLLKKNGVAVADDGQEALNADDDVIDQESTPTVSSTPRGTTTITPAKSSAIPITKYLWDDPGDIVKGIATVHIEVLPTSARKDTYMDWKEVASSVVDVSAEILNKNAGLLVQFTATLDENSPPLTYELRIPRLYGEIRAVKSIQKEKRLLIKLTKERHKNNLGAWPSAAKKS
jgi:hypothetical protein